MTRLGALIAFGLAVALGASSSAAADDDAALSNSKVRIAERDGDGGYRVTSNPEDAAIREKMMDRQALEEFAKFLSPMRLPKTLWIYADECQGGAGASPYYSRDDRALVMCYQFMKVVEQRANLIAEAEAKNPNAFPMRVSRDGFIAGVFAGVILHEAGHAMFDILDVPIFGREEDAADEFSTFVAVQFDKQLADVVVSAYADIDETFNNPPTSALDPKDPNYPKDKTLRCFADPFCSFADVHGTWGQRFYNTLCLTYGSDPAHYAFLQSGGWLPANRDCVGEYRQVYRAFAATIYPFIDQDMRAKVQARQWFRPNELQ